MNGSLKTRPLVYFQKHRDRLRMICVLFLYRLKNTIDISASIMSPPKVGITNARTRCLLDRQLDQLQRARRQFETTRLLAVALFSPDCIA